PQASRSARTFQHTHRKRRGAPRRAGPRRSRARPSTTQRGSRGPPDERSRSRGFPLDAALQVRERAVANDPHVAGAQAQGAPDLVGIAIFEERGQDYCPFAGLEPAQAVLESYAVDLERRGLVALRQARGGFLRNPPLARVSSPLIHDRVAAGPEHVRVEPRGVFDAP